MDGQSSLAKLAGLFCALTACQSTAPPPQSSFPARLPLERDERPAKPGWLLAGSGLVATSTPTIRGVGTASKIKNRSLALSTASNRARHQLAQKFEVLLSGYMKMWHSTIPPGALTEPQQQVEGAIRGFSNRILNNTQIVAHWRAPDGTIASLAELDLVSSFRATFGGNPTLSKGSPSKPMELLKAAFLETKPNDAPASEQVVEWPKRSPLLRQGELESLLYVIHRTSGPKPLEEAKAKAESILKELGAQVHSQCRPDDRTLILEFVERAGAFVYMQVVLDKAPMKSLGGQSVCLLRTPR